MKQNVNQTTQYKNPDWWNEKFDSGWDRVKEALARDWDQTKHDFGGKTPDKNQGVGDTIKQAAGKEPIPARNQPNYEEIEPAVRFGYGARQHYGKQYHNWNDDLQNRLERDWKSMYADEDADWDRYESAVRRGWDYKE